MRHRSWLTIVVGATAVMMSARSVVAAQDSAAAHAVRRAPVKVILTLDASGGPSDGQLLSDVDLELSRQFALDSTVAFNSPGRTGQIVTTGAGEPYIDVRVWITRRFGLGPAAATLDWQVEASEPGVHPDRGSTARGGPVNAAAHRAAIEIAQDVRAMAATLRP